MRAHEQFLTKPDVPMIVWSFEDSDMVIGSTRSPNQLCRDSVRSHPEGENLASKERHKRFQEWSLERNE